MIHYFVHLWEEEICAVQVDILVFVNDNWYSYMEMQVCGFSIGETNGAFGV